ncbi:MAG: ABC transporter permease, partial [Candidatus Methylomirabilales bacterium]
MALGAPRWLQATVRFARRKPLGASGAAVILLMGLAAILADLLAPHDPLANDFLAMFKPPGGAYWLGT